MDSIVKFCTGSSKRALLSLLIVIGVHTVGVHKVEAATQFNSTGVETSVENGQPYLVGNSPLQSSSAGAMMTVTFNKNTGTLVCVGGVSTFATWPATPYDWNISVGTPIPVSVCRTNDTHFTTGEYRTFVCSTSPTYFCDGQDWGYSTYPTYTQAMNTSAYYTDFEINGGTVVPIQGIAVSSNFETKFTDYAYNLSSSTLEIDVDYFINYDEIDTTNPARNPTLIAYRYKNTSSSTPYITESQDITPIENGNASTTQLISLPDDGVYIFEISFSNIAFAINEDPAKKPFKETYIIFEIEVVGGVVVDSNEDPIYNGENNTSVLACSDGLVGALCNVGAFLIIPSNESINQFSTIYDTLSTKFPFAYLTDFRDSITSIYTSSTTASLGLTVPFGVFGDITLISAEMVNDVPFTSTIRTLLGALIWVMLGAQIWRRGQTIFNVKTA